MAVVHAAAALSLSRRWARLFGRIAHQLTKRILVAGASVGLPERRKAKFDGSRPAAGKSMVMNTTAL